MTTQEFDKLAARIEAARVKFLNLIVDEHTHLILPLTKIKKFASVRVMRTDETEDYYSGDDKNLFAYCVAGKTCHGVYAAIEHIFHLADERMAGKRFFLCHRCGAPMEKDEQICGDCDHAIDSLMGRFES